MENERKRTIVYRSKNLATRKIGIAAEEVVESAVKEFTKDIVFYSRGEKFSSI